MSKISEPEPVQTPCEEEEERQPVVEREFTTGGRLRKIILKTFLLLFIFSLGFILGELCSTDQTDQVDNSYPFWVYVYDTEQKVEDFYKMYERGFSEEIGLPPESPKAKEFMAMVRNQLGWPLVAVGPFAIFVNHDGDEYSVFEIQSVNEEIRVRSPLITLATGEQSKRLIVTFQPNFLNQIRQFQKTPKYRIVAIFRFLYHQPPIDWHFHN